MKGFASGRYQLSLAFQTRTDPYGKRIGRIWKLCNDDCVSTPFALRTRLEAAGSRKHAGRSQIWTLLVVAEDNPIDDDNGMQLRGMRSIGLIKNRWQGDN